MWTSISVPVSRLVWKSCPPTRTMMVSAAALAVISRPVSPVVVVVPGTLSGTLRFILGEKSTALIKLR